MYILLFVYILLCTVCTYNKFIKILLWISFNIFKFLSSPYFYSHTCALQLELDANFFVSFEMHSYAIIIIIVTIFLLRLVNGFDTQMLHILRYLSVVFTTPVICNLQHEKSIIKSKKVLYTRAVCSRTLTIWVITSYFLLRETGRAKN